MKKLTRQMDLDLEIHPIVVYRQLCKQQDREVDPAVDDAAAAAMPDVMEIVNQRVVQLLAAGMQTEETRKI